MFNIPIVLFVFKRKDTITPIMEILQKIQPTKIYIMSDEGRNEEEKKMVTEVRQCVENLINWDCNIIKNYASKNRGVYKNIGLGARWVFEREENAIFLEDDNLPEVTFFPYCECLLKEYNNIDKILWICGTNYLGSYKNENNDSYMFTQNLLPCGWASWSWKFLKYYDYDFLTLENEANIDKLKLNYKNKKLFKQQSFSIGSELYRKKLGLKYGSWDYHMAYSIRYYNLFGISPSINQIKNIGVDEISEHGGNSLNMIMTKRFCEIETKKLDFPLNSPSFIEVDKNYEDKIDKIILLPYKLRLKSLLSQILKKILRINKYEPLKRKKK